MPDVTSIVFVVDDDVSVRESLELLIRAAGWQPETFASALEFLSRPRPTVPCCLVLDVTLPGLSGLELQQQLAERTDMPIIFITGHGDVPMTVQAMKAGAVEFLTKPFTRRRAAGRHRRRHRAKSHRAAPGVGNASAAELLRVTDSTRTRGDGVGRLGSVEQAGRRRTWHQRDHGQGAPRSGDAQDEGRLSSRLGDHGRETRPAACAERSDVRMSSLGFVLLGALAVIVGALIPVQAATNAAMSRVVGSVAITSLALFAIGFVVVAAWAIVIRVPLPSLETLRHVPAYGYFGGFIVASYVISITFLAPRLGVGNAIRLVVTGQIVAAVIIDHVGAFGAIVQRLTMGRAIGVVLMIIGVILARR